MFLKRITRRVTSKDADEMEAGMLGNSLPHCVGLIIFLIVVIVAQFSFPPKQYAGLLVHVWNQKCP